MNAFLEPAPDFVSVFAPINDTETDDLAAARTLVVKLYPPALLAAGYRVQLRINAPAVGALPISKAYIGPAATSGHAWNFSAGTQITFDVGAAGVTADNQGTVESDVIAFALDGSKAILLALELPIGARLPFARDLGDDVVTYYKDSVSEAASTTKGTGYTALVGQSFVIAEIVAASNE